MIAGYETKREVRAQIDALEREKGTGHMTPRRLETIEGQQALFRRELERMEATGEGEEPVTTNKAMGTGAWVGRDGRGLIV